MRPEDIVPGTIIIGNVNGARMQIVKVEGNSAVIKDLSTGVNHTFGVRGLQECDVMIERGDTP